MEDVDVARRQLLQHPQIASVSAIEGVVATCDRVPLVAGVLPDAAALNGSTTAIPTTAANRPALRWWDSVRMVPPVVHVRVWSGPASVRATAAGSRLARGTACERG